MPTYAYACRECGHTFDAVQSFTDDALTTCPECSGALRKVYGSIGVSFKGSGFYRNDSRASANGAAAKAESGSDKSDKGSDSKGTDKSSDKKGSEKKSDGAAAAKSSEKSPSASSSSSGPSGSKASSTSSS